MGNKKVKLLYLINSFDVGGAEKAMVRILSKLDRDKYDVKVTALKRGSGRLLREMRHLNIPFEILEIRNLVDILKIIKLGQLISDFNPDLLVCSLFHSSILGRIVGRMLRVPIIVNWEHSTNLGSGLRRFLRNITCPLVDKVLCDSNAVEKEIKNSLGLCRDKTVVVPIGGLDVEEFGAPGEEMSDMASIGSVGRLLKEKGYDVLLQAFKEVSEKHSNVTLSIAGDGPELESLLGLRKELGLSRQAHFLGFRDDVPDLLSSWDIYVQPSRWEGLCITVIEAMASGLPVVATNVGGIPESVVDGKTGFLVHAGDMQELAEKINLLIENPRLRRKMGSEGRDLIRKNYSLKVTVRRFESVLDGLIGKKIGLSYNQSSSTWEAVK